MSSTLEAPTEDRQSAELVVRRIVHLASIEAHAVRVASNNGKKPGYLPVKRPLTPADINVHLSGSEDSRAVYLIPPDADRTRLAVLDFDDHEGGAEAKVLQAAKSAAILLRNFGFPSLPVRSGGGKGIHLWFRWEDPQLASNVRTLLTEALDNLGLKSGGRGVRHKEVEVFPKQDRVAPGGFGNPIALPFGRASRPLSPESLQEEDTPSLWSSSIPIQGFERRDRGSRWEGPPPELEMIREALQHLMPDDYHLWIRVGYAIHSAYPDDEGLALWDEWSRGSQKYTSGECERLWQRNIHPTRISIGSLFHWARTTGWPGPRITLDTLNQSYAFCIVGNKSAVLEESMDAEGRPTIDFMSLEVFRDWHRELRIEVETEKGSKWVPLANRWLEWAGRRKYRGVEFAPPPLVTEPLTYNLFQGWSVEPAAGDCSLFLEHLKQNVCQGDDSHYQWVLAWFASLFQKPAHKPGTALALRGKQGTGKSKVGEVIGRLLGNYIFKASSPHQVTGNFNSHLKSCLLLQAEEAFWAGDKAAEGVLKDLITSDDLRVEFKGRDIIRMRNCIRLLVTSNAEWVVPASYDDRRFTVLDVGEGRMRDHDFFAALDEQMKSGGYAALLQLLLDHKYDEGLIRRNLDTQGARDQKIRSLNPWEGWLVDLVEQGWLPGDGDGLGRTFVTEIQADCVKHIQGRRGRHVPNNTEIGIQLKKWFPTLRKERETINGKILYSYVFPPLSVCRSAIHERLPGFDADWNMMSNWEADPFKESTDGDRDVPF